MEIPDEIEEKKEANEEFYIYILVMSNGNFYTGWTKDLERRYLEHKSGKKGAKFTRAFKAREIAAFWKFKGNKSTALKIEAFIKKQTREQKESLIKNPEILGKYYFEKTSFPVELLRCKKGAP